MRLLKTILIFIGLKLKEIGIWIGRIFAVIGMFGLVIMIGWTILHLIGIAFVKLFYDNKFPFTMNLLYQVKTGKDEATPYVIYGFIPIFAILLFILAVVLIHMAYESIRDTTIPWIKRNWYTAKYIVDFKEKRNGNKKQKKTDS